LIFFPHLSSHRDKATLSSVHNIVKSKLADDEEIANKDNRSLPIALILKLSPVSYFSLCGKISGSFQTRKASECSVRTNDKRPEFSFGRDPFS
jgi:hypothetical protein